MSKRVAIIGAGPSGLVAAKSLLHDHPKGTFAPIIFEKHSTIGGLWPVSLKDVDGLVNPDMSTNQSKHTVCFSDLAWDESTSNFPKAWEVGQYLERYAAKYITPHAEIRRENKVIRALRDAQTAVWTLKVENAKGVEEHSFDHVIVAAGFFGEPQLPKDLIPEGHHIPMIHSSKFRTINQLLSGVPAGGKVLVVGGQMSGVEVAAAAAAQLSSELMSPNESSIPNIEQVTIHHVVTKPLWIMPLHFPTQPMLEFEDKDHAPEVNPGSPFMPLDLVMYNIARRPPGPFQDTSGVIAPEAASLFHGFMKTNIGSSQAEIGLDPTKSDHAPWLAVSDGYSEFVRSGKIVLHHGHAAQGEDTSPGNSSSKIKIVGSDNSYHIDEIAAVIVANGFNPAPSIKFLPQEILDSLEFDAKSPFPLNLQVHSSVNSNFPELGFVGFYRSPYWGVMEMQAKYLGKLWVGDERAIKVLSEFESPIPARRKCFKESPERLAQFPMGDYTFLMEQFSQILAIPRLEPFDSTKEAANEEGGELRTGIVLPSRYTFAHQDKNEIEKAIANVRRARDESATKHRFVARAIIRALQGRWSLERRFESRDNMNPSGNLKGTANFHPRTPTDVAFDLEHLYEEEGEFKTDSGLVFHTNRRYVHRYQEASDTLSVWFVKPKEIKEVDYLFHEMEILAPENGSGWRAKAYHWCQPDNYNVQYEFKFAGVGIEEWTMAYTVKGPNKDYTISSKYRR